MQGDERLLSWNTKAINIFIACIGDALSLSECEIMLSLTNVSLEKNLYNYFSFHDSNFETSHNDFYFIWLWHCETYPWNKSVWTRQENLLVSVTLNPGERTTDQAFVLRWQSRGRFIFVLGGEWWVTQEASCVSHTRQQNKNIGSWRELNLIGPFKGSRSFLVVYRDCCPFAG